ncbi:hypothetical protein [Clostridium vincentii]|uniref:Helicase C-terminal domain-containing protein n=1 Tax=Clostridium vincentii TaxID=52704 RepID=A0A2T0BGY2_9CLOT|nr:hypothetical protein [Clostridium vincentii]PRR83134.1 hypothetical protein CLVI_11700 [Clostridium vincentii]
MNKKDVLNYGELDFAVKKIAQWYKKKVKCLSIITAPYNSTLIFIDIILDVIKEGRRVLYVCGSDRGNKELIEGLEKTKTTITYGHLEEEQENNNINFIHYNNLSKVEVKYELVIFDDISNNSLLTKKSLREMYQFSCSLGERGILYSIDNVSPLGDSFELIPMYVNKPFVEPRFITTRIDLKKDIPYSLYDYLKWFRNQKKRVVLFVPDSEKLALVYEYYKNKLNMDGARIMMISKKDDRKAKKCCLKIKDKAIFIITDYMEVSLEDSMIEGAIVLFADDKNYSYKKLMYICGNIGRINKILPEVLFVSRDITEAMDNVKNMGREFNKMIWEKRLIKS